MTNPIDIRLGEPRYVIMEDADAAIERLVKKVRAHFRAYVRENSVFAGDVVVLSCSLTFAGEREVAV
jgi:hypothetical protein